MHCCWLLLSVSFSLSQGEVARYSGYTVNMLHYEDAARLALAILRGDGNSEGPYRSKVFVGTDGNPLTFQEMVDACFESGLFGQGSVKFTGTPETSGLGKVVVNESTRKQLGGWEPRYESFKSFFLENKGKDYYNSGAKTAVGAPHQG
jgi:nucleoside-diphosphate-sugar epimerase